MVVLESAGTVMTSTGHQYLQPDYLSPLPTTLDAKKSPLALLAQTCSQIGADTPSAKSPLPSSDRAKKGGERSSTTPPKNNDSKRSLAFKPYEANVLSKKSETPRPASKSAADPLEDKRRTPGRKSASPAATKEEASAKSESPESGASPVIRSGLEVLQGRVHPKDSGLGGFKPALGGALAGLPPGCCPPGLEANPAFRPPLAGFSHHHAAVLAAAAAAGYPGPYVGYARVKTPAGGEALVPVCKDPYCGGCQLSVHSALVGAGAAAAATATPCPGGCTQCDHQKYLGSLVPPHPFSAAAAAAAAASYPLGRPYVCNWIAGDNYCGKRFSTSEELLQHLRTHTADSLNPLRYPNPPLSPLSAARYHPYSKPGATAGLPASLGASPFSAFNPTALGPYYSPYALYGGRLGAAAAAAAVHP